MDRFFKSEEDRKKFSIKLSESYCLFISKNVSYYLNNFKSKYGEILNKIHLLNQEIEKIKADLNKVKLDNNPQASVIVKEINKKIAETNKELYNLGRVERYHKAWFEYEGELADTISVSDLSLDRAIKQIVLDIEALDSRRGFENGIASGKIAGCLAYRLARFEPLACIHDQLRNTDFGLKLNVMFSLDYVLRYLKIHEFYKISDKKITEIAYQLERRHANQETLGLIFEALISSAPNDPSEL